MTSRAPSRGRRLAERTDLYVTSTVACLLVVLNVVDVVPASYVEAAVPALLALMSINMLLTRTKIDEIANARHQFNAPVTLDPFPPSYDENWRHPGDILLYGTSLLDTFVYYQQWIAERLIAGRHVRVLLMYYRYRMNSDDQLRLVLRPRDGRWFNLHRDQLEHLWRDAGPYAAPSPESEPSTVTFDSPALDRNAGPADADVRPRPISGSGS